MREYTTPAVIEVSASARLSDAVFDRADSDPGSVLLRRKAAAGAEGDGGPQAQWKDVPARQFRDEVAAVAKGLIAAGIGEGDRVALMSRTRYEWTVADYAIWTAGAVTVPIYETSSAEQVEWILSNSGARAAIVETSARLATFSDVLERLPDVTQVWLMDPDPAGPTEPLDALVAGGAGVSDTVLLRRRMSRGAADLATIIYTSGTTGRPKGCEITHKNLLAAARNAVHGPLAAIFETPGASTLLFLPLAHSFARIIEVGVIEAGAVLGHTPDMANLLPDLATFQPTFILAVPRVFEKVFNSAQQQAADSSIKGPVFEASAKTAIAGARRSAAKTRQRPGGPGRACASSTPCSIASSTASSGRRSAAGWRSRYPVAPRSESGWAISSVALGSPSSRATASPRRPPPPR
jgi:long-chain acyl-CoA synthetase